MARSVLSFSHCTIGAESFFRFSYSQGFTQRERKNVRGKLLDSSAGGRVLDNKVPARTKRLTGQN